MNKPWSEWTNTELADEAQTGLRGQGAVVEMMSRLKKATDNLNRSTTILFVINIGLTIVIVILAITQAG